MSAVPAFIVFAFLWLEGNMENIDFAINPTGGGDDENNGDVSNFVIGLIAIAPGLLIGAVIRMKTKVTEAP